MASARASAEDAAAACAALRQEAASADTAAAAAQRELGELDASKKAAAARRVPPPPPPPLPRMHARAHTSCQEKRNVASESDCLGVCDVNELVQKAAVMQLSRDAYKQDGHTLRRRRTKWPAMPHIPAPFRRSSPPLRNAAPSAKCEAVWVRTSRRRRGCPPKPRPWLPAPPMRAPPPPRAPPASRNSRAASRCSPPLPPRPHPPLLPRPPRPPLLPRHHPPCYLAPSPPCHLCLPARLLWACGSDPHQQVLMGRVF